jgi:hypothetical protein
MQLFQKSGFSYLLNALFHAAFPKKWVQLPFERTFSCSFSKKVGSATF